MIKDWKYELEKHGFSYRKWNSQEKALVKYVGSIEQQIWEQRIQHDGKKILINTAISVADRFREEQEYFLPILAFRLDADGVVLPRSDKSVGKFWKYEESNDALNALCSFALPWFEEYSLLEKLIEYVANDVVVWPVSDKNRPNCTWFFKELFLSKFRKKPKEFETRVPPINHLKLSLLYYHSRQMSQACGHAREWLKHVQKGGAMPGEPERTFRQLNEMGCLETEVL
jgi:hypothetical protein